MKNKLKNPEYYFKVRSSWPEIITEEQLNKKINTQQNNKNKVRKAA